MPDVGLREWIAAGRAIASGHLLRYDPGANLTSRFEKELGGTGTGWKRNWMELEPMGNGTGWKRNWEAKRQAAQKDAINAT